MRRFPVSVVGAAIPTRQAHSASSTRRGSGPCSTSSAPNTSQPRASRSSTLSWRICPTIRVESSRATVVEWVAKHLSHRAEAVVIGGNGFRAARAIHHLERWTGRLVLEANRVLLWSVLESTAHRWPSEGSGCCSTIGYLTATKAKER